MNCGLVPITLNSFTSQLSFMRCTVSSVDVCVVGQGKIGLPLAVAILQCNTSNSVTGIDLNEHLILMLRKAQALHIIEENFSQKFEEAISSHRLQFASDYEPISKADVVVVAVPLKVDKNGQPLFQDLQLAFQEIGKNLQPGALVILETTVPVGTCRSLLIPTIEASSRMIAGKDFAFAFSPERISSGRFFHDLYTYPKLIGPLNTESGSLARDFYLTFLSTHIDFKNPPEVRILSSIETAEFTKLAESIYRDLNIALANVFSYDCHQAGVDYFEVKHHANSQSFSHLHSPGIYVGGHCIPVYPHLYDVSFPKNPFLDLIRQARHVNNMNHKSIIDLVLEEGNRRQLLVRQCLILGASYRGNVKEIYDSGVFPIARYLESLGFECVVFDPLFSEEELVAHGLKPVASISKDSQLIILNSDHSEFLDLNSQDFCASAIVIDGRNILNSKNFFPGQLFSIGVGWNS
jgi:nucleotide sugar dehydrogenase